MKSEERGIHGKEECQSNQKKQESYLKSSLPAVRPDEEYHYEEDREHSNAPAEGLSPLRIVVVI